MGSQFLVANLKSNQSQAEARSWIGDFLQNKDFLQNLKDIEVIICPSLPFLSLYKELLAEANVKIGAQNISPFGEGAYTGEVAAYQIGDLVDYVLIGHSERRENFKEDQQMLEQKVKEVLENGLTPIFCVQSEQAPIPNGVKIVAYEPTFAIGSGNPDTPENANHIAEKIKEKGELDVLYGGSVTPQNIGHFLNQPNIRGALVGGASLNAKEFIQIIQNAK